MNNLIIRNYRAADYQYCRKLAKELTQHHRDIYKDPSIGGDTPEDYFDEDLKKVGAQRIWISELGGAVIGFAGLILEKKHAEIEPIIISLLHRGKGVGEKLIKRVIEEAKLLGAEFISIKPVARNLEAIRFYYKIGFRIIGEIELLIDLRVSENDIWKKKMNLFELTFKY